MNKLFHARKRWLVISVVCVCLFSFTLVGCEPLRKKFTRKKKEDKTKALEPILTPVDYGVPQISPEERYRHHYSLWKVWQEDLIEAVNQEESDKKQKYAFLAAIAQLEEMKKWIPEEKQRELIPLIDEAGVLQKELDKPAGLRNVFSFRRKIEILGKKIRHSFSSKAMTPFDDQVK